MGKLFVVMYHYTRDLKHSRYPEIKGLDVSLFREQLIREQSASGQRKKQLTIF